MSIVRQSDRPAWPPLALVLVCFVYAALASSHAQLPPTEASFGRGDPPLPVAMTAECPGVVISSGALRDAYDASFTVGDHTLFSVQPDNPRLQLLTPLIGKTVDLVIREVPTRTREVLIRKEDR